MILKTTKMKDLYYCEIVIIKMLKRKELKELIRRYKFKETINPNFYVSEEEEGGRDGYKIYLLRRTCNKRKTKI